MRLIGAVIRRQKGGHKVLKSVLRKVFGRRKFTVDTTHRRRHGASRSMKAMSAGLVETRRAPSRHRRDVRVYGYITTAMHN